MLNQEMCYKSFMYRYVQNQQLRERPVIWKAADRGKIRSAVSAWFTALLIEDIITVEPSTPVSVWLTVVKRQHLSELFQSIPVLSTLAFIIKLILI